ncbi:DUF4091 domain-containing protein [Hyalangium sp.]|uniref:DUF4091 domain-containing protein n=1 Tax=Hyalangium sp. TaxID=2028555 RepID=UPI002D6FABD0|nr:glycoside hydrolase domain-containing protein [Hyalangium sp.]HYH98131.1 glycoside hydrolase domain-containing protein [Hyalangium sp.]
MRIFSAPLLSVLIASTVSAAPAVWTEGPLLKVGPSAQVKSAAPARLAAARNEFESFQIVIRGDVAVSGVRARASQLTGPNGATIPATNVRLYRESLINVTQPSGSIGTRGRYPDGLIPDVDEIDGQTRSAFPFNVPAGEARALWVDVLVPLDAQAGTYTGSIEVTADGFNTAVPMEVEVLDFELPSTPTLATAFRAWPGFICMAHTGAGDCGGANVATELLMKYARLALDHRITLSNISNMRLYPGDTHGVLGKVGNDWTGFDTTFGALLKGTGPTQLPGARFTSIEYAGDVSAATLASYSAHAREQGFFDRVFDYTVDEPPYGGRWEDIIPRSAAIHAAAPGLRTLVTTDVAAATEHSVLDSLDILVPVVNFIDSPVSPYIGNQRPHYDEFVSKGGEVWMYQSCMSHGCSFGGAEPGAVWPSYMVDVPAPRNRAMQWVDFAYGATGELYYETVMTYDNDPWTSQFAFSGNGDGTLLYPGKPAKIGGTSQVPVPSLRLKHIRDGVEDYEYLTLLVKLGDSALAQKLARDVVPTAHHVSDDPNVILQARLTAGRRIAELSMKPGPVPGGPGTEVSQPGPSNPTPGLPTPGPGSLPGGKVTPDANADGAGAGCSAMRSSSLAVTGLGLVALVLAFRRRKPLKACAKR